MRIIIFLILGMLVIPMKPGVAQTNQPVPAAVSTNALPPDVLVTKEGAVYDQYRVVGKDPAGLIIRYVPEGGGLGIEKVPFMVLPDDWQKRYEYDPKKAVQFNQEQQKAIVFWRNKMIAEEEANREKWARLAAAEEAAEQAKREAAAAAALGTNAPAIQTNDVLTIQVTNTPSLTDTNLPPKPQKKPPPPPPPTPRPTTL